MTYKCILIFAYCLLAIASCKENEKKTEIFSRKDIIKIEVFKPIDSVVGRTLVYTIVNQADIDDLACKFNKGEIQKYVIFPGTYNLDIIYPDTIITIMIQGNFIKKQGVSYEVSHNLSEIIDSKILHN